VHTGADSVNKENALRCMYCQLLQASSVLLSPVLPRLCMLVCPAVGLSTSNTPLLLLLLQQKPNQTLDQDLLRAVVDLFK
jgi:hypothetical protein